MIDSATTRPGLAVVGSGLIAAAVAAALAGLDVAGRPSLDAGIFVVQVVIALAWLAALDAKGAVGGFAIAVACAAAADILVSYVDIGHGPDIGRAAPVIGVAVLVSLAHQLARKDRRGLTMSLGATVSAVALGVCASAYPALRVEGGGDQAVVAALIGAGAALGIGRLADLVVPRPTALPASRRGLVGLLAGIAAAIGVAAAYGNGVSLGADLSMRLAGIAAVLAVVADLAVDAVLANAPPRTERPRSALSPLGALLPVVLAGPAVYVAGRILLG